MTEAIPISAALAYAVFEGARCFRAWLASRPVEADLEDLKRRIVRVENAASVAGRARR